MGSQVPDVPVRFDVSFGRRLLRLPSYAGLPPVQRLMWFEANLIATEFDGWFPVWDLQRQVPGGDLQPIVDAGLFEDLELRDGFEWYHIAGWDKYQPSPRERRNGGPMTGAERVAKHRAKKRAEEAGVTLVTPGVTEPLQAVTPHAGASSSSSSSSSFSRDVAQAHVREMSPVSDAVRELREYLRSKDEERTS